MEIEEIRAAVQATLAAVAPEADVHAIRPDQPLRGQIDLDSMDWINVIAGLHDRLRIDIPESDYERLTTLDALVAYLASRPAAPAAEAAGAPGGLPCTRRVVNGVPVTVRPIRAEDAALEADFVQHLSLESRYGRFMVAMSELPQAKLKYLTEVDQVRHVALVATVERDGHEALVGVARYVVDPSGTGCEFAAAVDDAWQGSGVAGILMHALIGIARARGLKKMEGLVLATTTRMLKFTRQLGFSARRDPEERDTMRVELPLCHSESEESRPGQV
jgi:acetyltransferase